MKSVVLLSGGLDSATVLFGLAALLIPFAASGSHIFQPGDVIAGGQTPSIVTASGRFDWFLPDGTLHRRMAGFIDVFPFDFAFDRAGRLYSPAFFGVLVFEQTGQDAGSFERFPASAFASITFDRHGNAYVAANTSSGNLVKVDPSGNIIRGFVVPSEGSLGGGIWTLDLASDQCTMYYTAREKRVFRYDVCNAVPLADFHSSLPGSQATRLRILPDGGVLVADTEAMHRLNSGGSIIQSYDFPAQEQWRNLALDIDGRSFWATSRNMAFKFDLESGAVLTSFQSSDYLFNAIAVVGEPRAATSGSPASAAIPTLSQWMLVVLATCLAAFGVMRAHRSV
jgi:hypothetical protein